MAELHVPDRAFHLDGGQLLPCIGVHLHELPWSEQRDPQCTVHPHDAARMDANLQGGNRFSGAGIEFDHRAVVPDGHEHASLRRRLERTGPATNGRDPDNPVDVEDRVGGGSGSAAGALAARAGSRVRCRGRRRGWRAWSGRIGGATTVAGREREGSHQGQSRTGATDDRHGWPLVRPRHYSGFGGYSTIPEDSWRRIWPPPPACRCCSTCSLPPSGRSSTSPRRCATHRWIPTSTRSTARCSRTDRCRPASSHAGSACRSRRCTTM